MEIKQPNQDHIHTVGSSVVEFLTILVKYRWFLFLFVFIVTSSFTLYALLSPKWYKSSTSVLPAEQTNLLSAFGGLSSIVKNFSPTKGLASLSGPSELDRYIAILKSGTMIDDVIKTFKIRSDYDMEDSYYENVVKAFVENVEIDIQDEGNLTLSVYDKNPKKAADIANYMIAKLNKINTELSVTNAKANREFVEKRYLENVELINQLETDMKLFQEKYGVIAVPEQIEATVKAMAEIYATLTEKEVALNVLKKKYGEDSPLITHAEIEVSELTNKIARLNTGKDVSPDNINLLIPFKKAPALANRYLKIYKDLEIQYKILEFVQPLYEQAKVEEIRNTPSVLILDKASAPEKKSKPKGSLYFAIAFLSSTFVGLFIVFSLEGLRKIKILYPEDYAYIKKSLRFSSKPKT